MNSSKKYRIYGLGNALVDIDFETSVETIQKLNIDKGLMTLIDAEKHLHLLEELSGIKHVMACGGSAANTIMAVNQLGGKTFLSCKVAKDEHGDFYYEELMRNGVHTNLENDNRQHGTTGSCLVLVTPDADRTMNTHLGVSETLSHNELREDAIREAEYLYIEGYLSSSPTGCEAAVIALKHARKHGVKTALSLSDPNMITYCKAGLLEMLNGGIDLLFCNEDEAKLFCQSDNMKDIYKTLQQYAKTFAITQGPKGATIFDGEKIHAIDAKDVPVLDTVGAGDMFAGGFIYALTQGYDYKIAGIIGDIVASKIITKYGPRLAENEVDEVKAEIEQFLGSKS
jgi:sugar/nucleoside kinase (ribokinase family)